MDLDDELNENDAGVYVAAFPYESEGKSQWLLKPVVQMVFVVDLQISTLSSPWFLYCRCHERKPNSNGRNFAFASTLCFIYISSKHDNGQ